MSRIVPSQAVQSMDRWFPHIARGNRETVYGIAASAALRSLIDLVKSIPDELLILPPDKFADMALSIGTLESALEHWTHGNVKWTMKRIGGTYDPIAVIRDALVTCHDEAAPPTTAALAFIDPPELRDSIRRDISGAHQAGAHAEWKAATVLAGAAIEALLLWKLQSLPEGVVTAAVQALRAAPGAQNVPAGGLDRWDLAHYITVARRLDQISAETETAANLARDFRNLIHPGRVSRNGLACDRATALSALAAVEHVVRDLSAGA